MKSRYSAAASGILIAAFLIVAGTSQAAVLTLDNPKLSLESLNCDSFSPTLAADGKTLNVICNATAVKPTCTIAANPSSLPVGGGQVSLTATCVPLAISNYEWTANGAVVPGVSGAVLTQTIAATTTYSVKGTNVNGQGSKSADTVVTVGAAMVKPSCGSPTATQITTDGGFSSVSVTCSGSDPKTYAWKDPAGNTVLTTASGTLSPKVTTTYTVTATNAAGTSDPVGVTVVVNIPSPKGDCGSLSEVDVDVQAYYDRPGFSYTTTTMKKGEAYVMGFKTGDFGGIQSVTVQEYAGDVVTRYLTISKTRCDFAVPQGYNQEGTTLKKYFTVGVPYGPDFQVLEPNTQYYVNIKNENVVKFPGVDTCDIGKTCGFVLNFYR